MENTENETKKTEREREKNAQHSVHKHRDTHNKPTKCDVPMDTRMKMKRRAAQLEKLQIDLLRVIVRHLTNYCKNRMCFSSSSAN